MHPGNTTARSFETSEHLHEAGDDITSVHVYGTQRDELLPFVGRQLAIDDVDEVGQLRNLLVELILPTRARPNVRESKGLSPHIHVDLCWWPPVTSSTSLTCDLK